jgi:short-subunit dehydrogenase
MTNSHPVALVTGASAGIGREFALALAGRGYDLVLVARRRERLDELAATILVAHPAQRAEVVGADLVQPDAPATIAAAVAERGLAVDLLVNNAGFGTYGGFAGTDPAREHEEIAVNVSALVGLTHAFLPGMLARRRGGVINVASTASFQPVPYMAVYGATKAFVLSFSQALHEEARGTGVHVMALCPGATTTEFFAIAGTGAQVGMQRSVHDVVQTGLRAFDKKRAIAIDGVGNALLANTTRLLPRELVTRVGARLLRPR